MKRSTLDEFGESAHTAAELSETTADGRDVAPSDSPAEADQGAVTDGTRSDESGDDERQAADERRGADDSPADASETDTNAQLGDDSQSAELEPVTTFAAGSPGPCAACGDSTARRWRTDRGYVCPSCIEW